jgi:hypothetical protein
MGGDRIFFTNIIDRKDVIAAIEEAKRQELRPI